MIQRKAKTTSFTPEEVLELEESPRVKAAINKLGTSFGFYHTFDKDEEGFIIIKFYSKDNKPFSQITLKKVK